MCFPHSTHVQEVELFGASRSGVVLFFLRVLQTRAWWLSAQWAPDDNSFSLLLLCWGPSGPWMLGVSEANIPAQLLRSSLRSRQQSRHSEVLTRSHPAASGNLLPDASTPRQNLSCPPECFPPKSLPTVLLKAIQCLPIPFRKCRCSFHTVRPIQPPSGSQDKLLVAHHTLGALSLRQKKIGGTCKNQTWETSRKPDDRDQQS